MFMYMYVLYYLIYISILQSDEQYLIKIIMFLLKKRNIQDTLYEVKTLQLRDHTLKMTYSWLVKQILEMDEEIQRRQEAMKELKKKKDLTKQVRIINELKGKSTLT